MLYSEVGEECERSKFESTMTKFHHAGSFTTQACGLDRDCT